jgi:hypothetical protein
VKQRPLFVVRELDNLDPSAVPEESELDGAEAGFRVSAR